MSTELKQFFCMHARLYGSIGRIGVFIFKNDFMKEVPVWSYQGVNHHSRKFSHTGIWERNYSNELFLLWLFYISKIQNLSIWHWIYSYESSEVEKITANTFYSTEKISKLFQTYLFIPREWFQAISQAPHITTT